MQKLHYIPGSKLLLSKILVKKTELDLLEEEFCTVSEIPAKLAETPSHSSIPSYSVRTVNMTLQFEEVDPHSPDSGHLLADLALKEYYRDKTFFLAGDPTGSVYFLVDKKIAQKLKLDRKTFSVLHIAIVVIFNRIYLQALEDTAFVECSAGGASFMNKGSNLSLDLKSEIV